MPASLSISVRHDYISPELPPVALEALFPFRVIGNHEANTWRYLRREVPHHWYVDSRYPDVGFLNCDEAHILYHSARLFAGQNALEIGCWMGWSSAHIAAAGVKLDVVDPILAQTDFLQSMTGALTGLNVSHTVQLHPQPSPKAVETMAKTQGKKWAFIFIDGNHNRPGPLQDAQVAHRFAAENALVLFHDLTSPHVSEGLEFLRDQGWKTAIYQTMQIMGVAWRGDVQPVAHIPDPEVNWTVPDHLCDFKIIGLNNPLVFG